MELLASCTPCGCLLTFHAQVRNDEPGNVGTLIMTSAACVQPHKQVKRPGAEVELKCTSYLASTLALLPVGVLLFCNWYCLEGSHDPNGVIMFWEVEFQHYYTKFERVFMKRDRHEVPKVILLSRLRLKIYKEEIQQCILWGNSGHRITFVSVHGSCFQHSKCRTVGTLNNKHQYDWKQHVLLTMRILALGWISAPS